MSIIKKAVTGLLLTVASPAYAQSLEVVTDPIPQGYSNTCQSYALSFALARANVPGFRLDTLAQVRAAEASVRAAIDGEVRPGESPYSHTVWQRAVLRLTSNNYKLVRTGYSTLEALTAEAAAKTGISSAASLGGSVSYLMSKMPVLTSFSQIGSDTYKTGHIVTIFGVDLPTGPVSKAPTLLLLNSAVKRSAPSTSSGFAPICGSSTLPGDLRYTGALRLESKYVPKSYDNVFYLFWIAPNL